MITLKDDFNPIVSINGVDVEINEIPDRSITIDQYKTVLANSDGFTALHRKLDNEALKHATEHYLRNCRGESKTTYDYAVKNYIVPELLRRITN